MPLPIHWYHVTLCVFLGFGAVVSDPLGVSIDSSASLACIRSIVAFLLPYDEIDPDDLLLGLPDDVDTLSTAITSGFDMSTVDLGASPHDDLQEQTEHGLPRTI